VTHIYRSGWKLQEKGPAAGHSSATPSHVEVKGIASRMNNPIIIYKPEDLELVPEGSRVGVSQPVHPAAGKIRPGSSTCSRPAAPKVEFVTPSASPPRTARRAPRP